MVNLNLILKAGLAVLLFLCLLDMPYGYYQLVRYIAMMIFLYFAFKEYETNHQTIAFVYLGLAVLFQPLIKIVLGRDIWNVVDVIVALGILYSMYTKKV